jgi:hypothetical protein
MFSSFYFYSLLHKDVVVLRRYNDGMPNKYEAVMRSHWMRIVRGNQSSRRNPAPCRFVHHKYHLTWPGLEPEPNYWVAVDKAPGLWHGSALLFKDSREIWQYLVPHRLRNTLFSHSDNRIVASNPILCMEVKDKKGKVVSVLNWLSTTP